MLPHLLAFLLLMQSQVSSEPAKTSAPSAAQATKATPADADMDPQALLKVKRIYVDSFGDDTTSKELQSMIVSALVATNKFKVTENRERADAILKGVALEKTSQEVHAYGEGTSIGGASGAASSGGGSSNAGFVARHMGTEDSSLHTETIHDARVAVRLVNQDGDVIWTTTQESKGAKYKGSSADAADKCVKQLLHDLDKLKVATSAQPPTPVPSNPPSDHK